jgi:hypothetical protein
LIVESGRDFGTSRVERRTKRVAHPSTLNGPTKSTAGRLLRSRSRSAQDFDRSGPDQVGVITPSSEYAGSSARRALTR